MISSPMLRYFPPDAARAAMQSVSGAAGCCASNTYHPPTMPRGLQWRGYGLRLRWGLWVWREEGDCAAG